MHVGEDDHPSTGLVHLHAHLSHQVPGPAIGAHTPDDDAIDVEWRIAPPSSAEFPVDLAISRTIAIEPPPVGLAAVSTLRPRGHDPPDLIPKQPRAPPA